MQLPHNYRREQHRAYIWRTRDRANAALALHYQRTQVIERVGEKSVRRKDGHRKKDDKYY